MKKFYKIWCEWDMGENWDERVFSSKEKAEKEIEEADWENLVGISLAKVRERENIGITEIEVD